MAFQANIELCVVRGCLSGCKEEARSMFENRLVAYLEIAPLNNGSIP